MNQKGLGQTFLKLDFNERCDKPNNIHVEYFGESLWQYPNRQSLEQHIADLYQLSIRQVLCTNGGDEAILLLMRLAKERTSVEDSSVIKNASVILPLPAFSQYTWGVQSWKINGIQVSPNDDLSLNIPAILQAIQNTTHAITILTRPNNPTGELIDLERLLDILQKAKDHQGWVFLDEAYIEFSDPENNQISINLLNEFDNLVILRTLSKAYGLAGIRLGYLLGNHKIIQAFKERCLPFNISAPTLQIAAKALHINHQKELNYYCEQIIHNRNDITQWLIKYNISVLPSQANFICLSLPPYQAKAIQSFLLSNNIRVKTFQETELSYCLRITIPFYCEPLFPLLKQTLVPGLICLDMDGVLIDTRSSYDETIKATIQQLSGKIIPQVEIDTLRSHGGFNNDWVLTQKILQNHGFDFNLEQVTTVFQEFYLGKQDDGFVINEKALIKSSLVEKINTLSQTTFAIVTGRPRKEAIAGCRLIQLSRLDIVSLDDVQQGKPSPEGIEKLKEKYSKYSWMCGDNPDDMQAARKSNSLAIGIGKNNEASLYKAGADIVLNDINQLEAWLEPVQ